MYYKTTKRGGGCGDDGGGGAHAPLVSSIVKLRRVTMYITFCTCDGGVFSGF